MDRWAFAAQAVALSGAFLIVPPLLRALDSSALGMWYVFSTLGLLAQLAKNALEPTIARHIAAAVTQDAMSRARGQAGESQTDCVILASRRNYARAAIVIAVLLLGPASAFIVYLSRGGEVPIRMAMCGWLLYTASLLVNTAFGYTNPALQGGGDLVVYYKMVCVQSGLLYLAILVAIAARPDLATLGGGALVGAILGRAYAYVVYRRTFRPAFRRPSSSDAVSKQILSDGFRLGVAQIGGYLIVRSNILVASSVLGLKAAASYALTMQAFDLISTLSTTPFFARLPRLYRLRREGDMPQFRQLAGESLVAGLAAFVVMSTGFVAFGPKVLSVIRSGTGFLQPWAMVVLGLILLLELNHSISATLITASGQIPFTEAAVLAGIAVPAFALPLAAWAGWGVWALLAAQGVVQLTYNNWKWPFEMVRLYETSYRDLLGRGVSGWLTKSR